MRITLLAALVAGMATAVLAWWRWVRPSDAGRYEATIAWSEGTGHTDVYTARLEAEHDALVGLRRARGQGRPR